LGSSEAELGQDFPMLVPKTPPDADLRLPRANICFDLSIFFWPPHPRVHLHFRLARAFTKLECLILNHLRGAIVFRPVLRIHNCSGTAEGALTITGEAEFPEHRVLRDELSLCWGMRAVRSRSISAVNNCGRCSKVSYVAPLSDDIDLK
jgi:hypothetical protein